MIQPLKRHASRAGVTLLELLVALSVLTAATVAVLQVMQSMAEGINSETAQSDLQTRTTGTLYDISAELRQATAYSPAFRLEQTAGVPPSITFDLVNGVDSKGNIVWGNKICYRLAPRISNGAYTIHYLGLTTAQLIREETSSLGVTVGTVVEDRVPYHFKENGEAQWGFAVSREGNALYVSLSKFADSTIDRGDNYTDVTLNTPAARQSLIVTQKAIIFLRNPQSIMALE